MSRLEQLTAEFCPDGVEYRKLGDVVNILDHRSLKRRHIQISFVFPCCFYPDYFSL